MTTESPKPRINLGDGEWHGWPGGKRPFTKDAKVMIFLRCNCPRDAAGKIALPPPKFQCSNTYTTEQLKWEHKKNDGDIVLVRKV